MLAILPTRHTLKTFRELVVAMSNHDYDLVETISLIFKAMEYWHEMEDNIHTLLEDYETLLKGNDYAENDSLILRGGVEYLYTEIRRLLDRLDVRDSTGFLRCKFHSLSADDLIIEIEDNQLLPKDIIHYEPKPDLSKPAMDPPPPNILNSIAAKEKVWLTEDSEATLSSVEVDFMRELEDTTPLRGAD